MAGVGAASLICYVLGITRTNPMHEDGCDLPPEAFWGNGDDGAELCFAVPKARFSLAWALLCDCTDTPHDSDAVTHIDKYSACLGEFTLWGLSGAFSRKKKSARPKPFAVRMRSAAEKQCVWQPHRPDDIAQFPVTREELFAAFLACGVDRQQAWSCAERVRKGKTWTQLPHEISPALAAYCRTVCYLPPKAEICERLLLQDALAEANHEYAANVKWPGVGLVSY